MSASAEEIVKQVFNSIVGLEERLANALEELPAERQKHWRDRFRNEAFPEMNSIIGTTSK